ncbi:MAG: phenylalanine--tRNA ligase subunit alpha [Euryarchaeota archaeon]|jgi:phenylalanyl-tRNA synthetase alpha chain|nr:phenylalanine--tRNA ligase subunit alpha [Euryarchaeota archaeon]MBT4981979.1 phenylalanine--tRNA ligase subunit alpha [Euryarchaeota archaeon]MBT5184248.1 phenylalanine--tRNA ligase subunit alpha [Euryarchaeota archaeon]
MAELTNPERRMLRALQNRHDGWSLEEILSACNWDDQAIAVSAGHGLSNHGFLTIAESSTTEVILGVEGQKASEGGLLEARLWDYIQANPSATMGDLSSTFERHEAGPGIGLLKGLGVSIQGGSFGCDDSDSVSNAIEQRTAFIQSPTIEHELFEHFKGRKNLIEVVEMVKLTWKISASGIKVPKEELEEVVQIAEITPELLQGDDWKNAQFRPYDVSLEAAVPRSGRSHPMQALIERIRSIFLEMGFSELVDDYVQTAGWNMDALFIPQDHPAREMQDTFYLENPKQIQLDPKLLTNWKAIHEHGGDTESTGWGGQFSEDISKRGLLRTHTTVNTIQYLAKNPTNPCRVFAIDRVFRKESIDRTHLPEFHQIEGIIMEPGANLGMLVSTLKTFYAKMGYPEVRVRPAYFPYTEPSLEIEVKWRGKWLELGGAGIFRPEVTEPLGIKDPVCAWGMGLERLAMLVLGLDDIRQLYISDLEWLRNQPIL